MGTIAVDIVVIVSPDTKKQWVNQSISSAKTAINMADAYKLNLVIAEGIPGSSSKAIKSAVQKSKADYICFIDDDDYALPNAFTSTLCRIKEEPAAIFPREIHYSVCNGLFSYNEQRHGMGIYRRDVLESQKIDTEPTVYLASYATEEYGNIIDIMQWVYIHRIYDSKCRKIRANFREGALDG